MPETETRIEVVGGALIVVHNLTVDYDQPSEKAIEGLPSADDELIREMSLNFWSGEKRGRVMIPALHLIRPEGRPSTHDARRLLRNQGLEPCVPAEIAPLKNYYQELRKAEVWWVVALDSDNLVLWHDAFGKARVVCLRCADSAPPPGFRLDYTTGIGWGGGAWLAGIPQPG